MNFLDLDEKNWQVEKVPLLRLHMSYCYLTIMAVKDSRKEVIFFELWPVYDAVQKSKALILTVQRVSLE